MANDRKKSWSFRLTWIALATFRMTCIRGIDSSNPWDGIGMTVLVLIPPLVYFFFQEKEGKDSYDVRSLKFVRFISVSVTFSGILFLVYGLIVGYAFSAGSFTRETAPMAVASIYAMDLFQRVFWRLALLYLPASLILRKKGAINYPAERENYIGHL